MQITFRSIFTKKAFIDPKYTPATKDKYFSWINKDLARTKRSVNIRFLSFYCSATQFNRVIMLLVVYWDCLSVSFQTHLTCWENGLILPCEIPRLYSQVKTEALPCQNEPSQRYMCFHLLSCMLGWLWSQGAYSVYPMDQILQRVINWFPSAVK